MGGGGGGDLVQVSFFFLFSLMHKDFFLGTCLCKIFFSPYNMLFFFFLSVREFFQSCA